MNKNGTPLLSNDWSTWWMCGISCLCRTVWLLVDQQQCGQLWHFRSIAHKSANIPLWLVWLLCCRALAHHRYRIRQPHCETLLLPLPPFTVLVGGAVRVPWINFPPGVLQIAASSDRQHRFSILFEKLRKCYFCSAWHLYQSFLLTNAFAFSALFKGAHWWNNIIFVPRV